MNIVHPNARNQGHVVARYVMSLIASIGLGFLYGWPWAFAAYVILYAFVCVGEYFNNLIDFNESTKGDHA